MTEARISVSHLSFSWTDGTPVLADLSFTLGSSRVGLVAGQGRVEPGEPMLAWTHRVGRHGRVGDDEGLGRDGCDPGQRHEVAHHEVHPVPDALGVALARLLARHRLEAADLGVFAAAARYRQGERTSGAEGERLRKNAVEWLTGQGVRKPLKIIRSHAPIGRSEPDDVNC